GDGAQTDEEPRRYRLDLGLEPGTAGTHLAGTWCLVDASLALRRPLEVLDGVGHVDLVTRDARRRQCAVKEAAGRPDEWLTRNVLFVSRLLADHHQQRAYRPFAE